MSFVEEANDQFKNDDRLEGILIEPELKEKRFGRKKRMPGENCLDERLNSPIQQFRVEVFRPILDQIFSSLKERFSDENIGLMKVTPYFPSDSFKDATILSNNSSISDVINFSPII